MSKFILAILAAAALLSGCGGGGGGGGGTSTATDSFIAAVQQIIATSPDNAEPTDVEAVAVTGSETAEPANI